MNQVRPFISPFILFIALILFVFPMVIVKNNDINIYTYSGAELMRSSGINLPGQGLPPINVSGEMITVFILTVSSLFMSLFSLFKPGFRVVVGTISGVATLILVSFVFRVKDVLEDIDAEKLNDGNASLNFRYVFFLLIVALIISSIWNFVWYYRQNRVNKRNQIYSRLALKKCHYCSKMVPSEAVTCKYCSSSLLTDSHNNISNAFASNVPIHPKNVSISETSSESASSSKPAGSVHLEQKSQSVQSSKRRNRILVGLLIAVLAGIGGYIFIFPLFQDEITDISGEGIYINAFPVKKGQEITERITFNAVLNTQDAEVSTFLKAFELDKLMVEGEQERKIRCVGGGEGSANALDIIISQSPTQKLSLLQSLLSGDRVEVRKNQTGDWKASSGMASENKKLELEAIGADIARAESIFANKKRKFREVWESETGYFRGGTMFQNLAGKTTFEFADTSSRSLNGTHLCAIIKYSVSLTGELRPGAFRLDDVNSSLSLNGKGIIIYDLIDQVILEDKLEGDITLKTKLDKFVDDFSEITYSGRFSSSCSTLPSLNSTTDPSGPEAGQNENIDQRTAHPINPYFPYVRGKSYYFASNEGQDCNLLIKSRIDFIDSFSQKITFPNGNTADAVIMQFTEKYMMEDIYHHEWLSQLLPVIVSNKGSVETDCCDLMDITQTQICNCFVVTPTEVWIGNLERGNPVNLKRILNLGGNTEGRFGSMKRELMDYDTYYKSYRVGCKDIDSRLNFFIAPIKDSKLIKYSEMASIGTCCQPNFESDINYTCSIIWSTKGIYSIKCSWYSDYEHELQLVE